MKTKCVNNVEYINTNNALGMIAGIRKAVLRNRTDQEIFEADQRKLETYQRLLRRL